MRGGEEVGKELLVSVPGGWGKVRACDVPGAAMDDKAGLCMAGMGIWRGHCGDLGVVFEGKSFRRGAGHYERRTRSYLGRNTP